MAQKTANRFRPRPASAQDEHNERSDGLKDVEIVVLERLPNSGLYMYGAVPGWFVRLFAADQPVPLGQTFPFLDSLLDEAAKSWREIVDSLRQSGEAVLAGLEPFAEPSRRRDS